MNLAKLWRLFAGIFIIDNTEKQSKLLSQFIWDMEKLTPKIKRVESSAKSSTIKITPVINGLIKTLGDPVKTGRLIDLTRPQKLRADGRDHDYRQSACYQIADLLGIAKLWINGAQQVLQVWLVGTFFEGSLGKIRDIPLKKTVVIMAEAIYFVATPDIQITTKLLATGLLNIVHHKLNKGKTNEVEDCLEYLEAFLVTKHRDTYTAVHYDCLEKLIEELKEIVNP